MALNTYVLFYIKYIDCEFVEINTFNLYTVISRFLRIALFRIKFITQSEKGLDNER